MRHSSVSANQHEKGIPKIIHQTAGEKSLTPEIKLEMESLQARNPGWDYRFYTDSDIEHYIGRHYPQHLAAYRKINPKYGAARADLFRYLLMYREGGVYLDIKSAFTRPLQEVLRTDDTFLLSHWPNLPGSKYEDWGTYPEIANPRGEFQQCFIICTPGHAFLEAVIDYVLHRINHYDQRKDGVGKSVRMLTGPVAYSLAITPLMNSYPCRLIDSEKDLGFVYNWFKQQTGRKHRELFDIHYSLLEEPVVLQDS